MINFSESIVDGITQQMEWLDQGTVFALTIHGTVYRSVDNGRSWENQMSLFPPATPTSQRAFVRKIVPVADSSQMFFLGNNALWATSNKGEQYELRKFPARLLDVLPHPREANWSLAIDTQNIQNVYYSKDFGRTWSLLSDLVSEYFWPAVPMQSSPSDPIIIQAYVLKYQVTADTNYDLLRLEGLGQLVGFDSNFSTPIVFASNIRQLSVFADHIAVVIFKGGSSSNAILELTSNGGFNWTTARFADFLNISNKLVEIIEISEEKIYISVAENGQDWANLYSASLDDMIFSLILKHIAHPQIEGSEIVGVPFMAGTYLTNYYDLSDDSLSGTTPAKWFGSMVTAITWTQGSLWSTLEPSPYGCPDSCQNGQKCSLRLGWFNAEEFWAPETDVGLLLASGNEGCVNTPEKGFFLSRDGGWTWNQLAQKQQIFDIADHGAFIVFTSTRVPTNTFSYTVDYGETVYSCSFTSNGVYQPETFYSASQSTASSFVLNAYNSTDTMLFFIDFSDYYSQECVGENHPGTSGSDYEFWSPSDDITKQCLNGASGRFSRRKPNAQCYNPQKFEPIPDSTPCECDVHDYECSPCYERQGEECVEMAQCAVSYLYQEPSNCDGTWTKPAAYQKLPGNQCYGNIYEGTEMPCSSDSNKTRNIILISCVLFLGIVLIGGCGLFVYHRQLGSRYKHKKIKASAMEEFDDSSSQL